MATEKQIIANRANALKGGVKTEAGKAVSRLNAVSHGIFSNEVILPGEDSSLLESLRDKFMEQFAPAGEMETILVERIISSTWRLKRVMRSEARLSLKYFLKDDATGEPNGGIDYRYNTWQNVAKYENGIERQIYRALNELERIQQRRFAAEIVSPQDSPESSAQTLCKTPDPQPQDTDQPLSPSQTPKPLQQAGSQSPTPKTKVSFYETNPISLPVCSFSRSQIAEPLLQPPLENQIAAC
jgi:hypothetical protein